MIVGYISSLNGNTEVCESQKKMIEKYCAYHKIKCSKFFCDTKEYKRTEENAKEMHSVGYNRAYRSERFFPEYDNMIKGIVDGKIKTILVDTFGRLKACKYIAEFLVHLCDECGVHVIEVCGHCDDVHPSAYERVAIYHFTNKSELRPRVYVKSLDAMYTFVSQQKCWGTPCLYADFSIKKSEHKAYEQFRENATAYNVLVTSDFFHVDDKLGTFFNELLYLANKDVRIESMKEGRIMWTAEDFLTKKLQVAVYDCQLNELEKNLELERLNVFVRHKTSWQVADIYVEAEKIENDQKQVELQKLIRNVEKYDVILVRRFNVLHWRTSMFFKIVKQLKVPIYSMKEGGIYLER